jgi:hypothetical protein
MNMKDALLGARAVLGAAFSPVIDHAAQQHRHKGDALNQAEGRDAEATRELLGTVAMSAERSNAISDMIDGLVKR